MIRTVRLMMIAALAAMTSLNAQTTTAFSDKQETGVSTEQVMRAAMKPMRRTVGKWDMSENIEPAGARKSAYNIRRAALPFSLMFLSGASWGAHEALSHHWSGVHEKFPGLNPGFWNPDESWKNKYVQRNPDLGRNNTPIWFTDAKHLLASGTQTFVFGAGITLSMHRSRPWWHYLVDAGIGAVGYTAGNWLAYDVILR